MEDEAVHPCPQVTEADHIRSFINGTGVGLALMLLLNAGSIYRYLTSSANGKSRFSAKSVISDASNGSEVDQSSSKRGRGSSRREGELVATPSSSSYKLNPFDHLIGAVLVGIMLINIYTRVTRGVGHWLVQPCHYLTALLIAVTYSPSRDSRVFWVYLYAHWQGYFAFFGGDLSWYVNAAELYAFWLQHILMVLVPLYYLAVGRFNTHHSNFVTFLTVYIGTVVYHSMVLIPVGYWTLTDFDNMLCPFPGAEGLVGIWWREAMGIFSTPFACLVCYVPGVLADWFHSYRERRRRTATLAKDRAAPSPGKKSKSNNNNSSNNIKSSAASQRKEKSN